MKKQFFHRRRREIPELNTSSLPDLIFTILFFFMIVTNMRQNDVKVQFRQPKGKQLEKLENKLRTTTIFIGQPTGQIAKNLGNEPCIQINDRFVEQSKVKEYMSAERMSLPESERENMVVVLKIDKNVPMGMVNDIKQSLKKAYTLKVAYIGTRETSNEKSN